MSDQSLKNFSSLQFVLKKRKRNRFLMTLLCFIVLVISACLIMYAVRNTANFFYTPSEITKENILIGRTLRLGGVVEKGTVKYSGETGITFFVTDSSGRIEVIFNSLLPDLFREGQGVIIEGHFDERGVFVGKRVLVKHDETYRPKRKS